MKRDAKLMGQKGQSCMKALMTGHTPCRFLHDIAFGMSIVARGLRTNTDLLDEEGMPERATQPQQEAQAEGSGGCQSSRSRNRSRCSCCCTSATLASYCRPAPSAPLPSQCHFQVRSSTTYGSVIYIFQRSSCTLKRLPKEAVQRSRGYFWGGPASSALRFLMHVAAHFPWERVGVLWWLCQRHAIPAQSTKNIRLIACNKWATGMRQRQHFQISPYTLLVMPIRMALMA